VIPSRSKLNNLFFKLGKIQKTNFSEFFCLNKLNYFCKEKENNPKPLKGLLGSAKQKLYKQK